MRPTRESRPPYSIQRLNFFTDASWCVVDNVGAIVDDDRLLIRLIKEDAQREADRLNGISASGEINSAD